MENNNNMLLEFQVSQLISARASLKEVDKFFGLYAKKGKIEDLKQAHEILIKLTKDTGDSVKANLPAPSSDIDWSMAPLAPRNILMLKDKYPEKEEAYFKSWRKAVERAGWTEGGKLNYGAAVSIWKNYANRPEFMFQLEGEDALDAEVLELDAVNEEGDEPTPTNESNTSFRIKRFEDFK